MREIEIETADSRENHSERKHKRIEHNDAVEG